MYIRILLIVIVCFWWGQCFLFQRPSRRLVIGPGSARKPDLEEEDEEWIYNRSKEIEEATDPGFLSETIIGPRPKAQAEQLEDLFMEWRPPGESILPREAYTRLGREMPICRIVNGLWQIPEAACYQPQLSEHIDAMEQLVEAGFTTFDAGDIYGPATQLVGRFRKKQKPSYNENCQVGVLWAPRRPEPVTPARLHAAVGEAQLRLGAERLDLLHFRWPSPAGGGGGRGDGLGAPAGGGRGRRGREDEEEEEEDVRPLLEALALLQGLVADGTVRHVAVAEEAAGGGGGAAARRRRRRLDAAAEWGFAPAAVQVEMSILDQNPDPMLKEYCIKHDVKLTTHGSLLGGFFSEAWLGQPEPDFVDLSKSNHYKKHYRKITAWGSWDKFQRLLAVTKDIANKHKVNVANVATRWVLQQLAVGSVVIEAPLGNPKWHLNHTKKVFEFVLDGEDLARLEVAATAMPAANRRPQQSDW